MADKFLAWEPFKTRPLGSDLVHPPGHLDVLDLASLSITLGTPVVLPGCALDFSAWIDPASATFLSVWLDPLLSC